MAEVIYKDGKRPLDLHQLDRAIEMLKTLKDQVESGRLVYDQGDLSIEVHQDIILPERGPISRRLRIHGDIEYGIEPVSKGEGE